MNRDTPAVLVLLVLLVLLALAMWIFGGEASTPPRWRWWSRRARAGDSGSADQCSRPLPCPAGDGAAAWVSAFSRSALDRRAHV